jgi:two-component system, cell cycle sensor histidine kinase and response regulator CckA
LSRRVRLAVLFLGLLALGAGLWGYYAEDANRQSALELACYFWLPVLVLLSILLTRGSRSIGFLVAIALLDVEAALLGASPDPSLPFVVAVPLIGVAVAARLVPSSSIRVAYAAAWLASVTGVAIAVFRTLDAAQPSTLTVIPTFAFVDAVVLWLFWSRDTGRTRALQVATEAEELVRGLLDGVELVAVHVDRESRIDLINDYALKLTGWTRDQVIGRNWWDTFATPDRREEARERFRNLIRDSRSMENQRESMIQTRSGEHLLIRWSHVTRRAKNGEVTGVASLGEDITAARAAQEEKRKVTELLSTLVVSSPLPTIVVGLDRVVQMWNPAAEALLGWSEAETVGEKVPEMFGPRTRMSFDERFAAAIEGRKFDGELIDLETRAGTPLIVRLFGDVLRDRHGDPIGVAIQGIDVTGALEMEEQLREAQKMEAVGRLAGGVAHDFNNSLTAIGGFAALIVSSTQEDDTREAAQTILGASKHAADLTRELLAYSRRSLLQPQTIDVNALLASIQPMLRPLLGEDVTVVIEARTAEATVRIDPSGLERVILNLAANARDAMPGGGRVTIATDCRASDPGSPRNPAVPDCDWVVVSVTDTGMGIPAELHSKVFDPFFTTKPVGAGTGLGLAMVKGFVVQSGGRVELVSKPGFGTTIEILLPAASAPPILDATRPAPRGAVGNGETILVVEDEPAVAAVSFQVLSRNGYRVLLADRGESAVALLRAHTDEIALLLLDVILPDIHGPRLAEMARIVHPESEVLFASGYSADAMGRAGELAADVDLIEKPFAPDELLTRVRAALDRRGRGHGAVPGVAAGRGAREAGPTDMG